MGEGSAGSRGDCGDDVVMADETVPWVAGEILRRYEASPVDWPTALGASPSEEALLDRYRGCLLWGAVGDALGRAVEGWSPADIRVRCGPDGIRDYVPWRGWRSGPKGTITDDTQLTMEVARTLLAQPARFDGEDFARRLVDWLPIGRGKGKATTAAVRALARGESWWGAGLAAHSAGNGAAMRAAPVGLARAWYGSPWPLRRDAVLSALPTHTHEVGVAGAVVIGAGVAFCVRQAHTRPGHLDREGLLDFVSRSIVETAPTMERRLGGAAIFLGERIRELGMLLDGRAPETVFDYLYNGALALESVPAALYCFLRTPDDPRQVTLTAVNAGYDADTVASMAGSLAGAWNGARRLETEAAAWWLELEYRDELVALADGLAGLALRAAAQGAEE